MDKLLSISAVFFLFPKTFDVFQFNHYQMGLCYFNYMLLCAYFKTYTVLYPSYFV